MATNIIYHTLGSLVLYVQYKSPPIDAEWLPYTARIGEIAEAQGRARVLIRTEGGPPTPKQRKIAADVASQDRIKSAIVSDSVITRSIATAMRWLGIDINVFAVAKIEAAYRHLQITPVERAWLEPVMASAFAELKQRAESGGGHAAEA